MQRIVNVLIALAMTFGSWSARAAGDSKAADLLAQARAAIGGEKQLANVKGLACSGTALRMIGDRQMSGELSIDLQLPDKMVRSDSISPMGDAALVVTEQGVNGDQVVRRSRTLNTPPGAVIRVPPGPAHGSDAEAQALRNSRAELTRLTVALLATTPQSSAVEFKYAGEAESPDGKADVLDLTGAGSFAAKLFLDKATHRPLMIAYRGVAPRVVVQQQRGDAPAQAPPPMPEPVDIQMFLDDYKAVDGVLLPHHITRSVDGQPSEEITFKTIKVNPAFKAETFSAR